MYIPDSVIAELEQEAKKQAVRVLSRIGKECVAEAIECGNYTDHTGNLRSSIGYVVAVDGQVVDEDGFWSLGGADGPELGREKAYERAAQTNGLALIIIAGMDYAEYVADKGFDVLDSAHLLAKQLLSQLEN